MALLIMLYKMIFLLLLSSLFLSLSNSFGVGAGRILSKEEDLELDRQLKMLNKVPIKTVQIERGEIYDCIDIYKQPALDHPLLKDHKIKLRPTSQLKVSNARTSFEDRDSRANVKIVDCPKGTVPIRRTSKDDLIRAKSFFESHCSSINEITKSKPGQHVAIRKSKDVNGRPDNYNGVSGYINVANPIVPNDQFSSAQIWVESYLNKGDPVQQVTSLQAGWAVSSQLFGDNKTRLFIYSNKDEVHVQGCYSLHCLGFVQVNPKIPVGTQITTISVYKGQQYDIHVTIYKDWKGKGDWWLKSPYDDSWMGYWPDKIFPALNQGANSVAWGGMVRGTPNGLSAQMGNGEFPNHHYDQASYIVHLTLPYNDELRDPVDDPDYYETFVDHPECYSVEYSGFLGERSRYSFMFGGPGGANCGP